MIGWTIAAVLYVIFTAVLTVTVNILRGCWWKALGIVLGVQAGAFVFYVLIAVAFVAIKRGV